MLGVYTFVFGTVFKTRWGDSGDAGSTGQFAVILFAGLIVFQLFAEVVNRAPGLILSNANYVKKVVFPLEILPLVALGSALFHGFVSLIVLFAFQVVIFGTIPWTAIVVPVVLLPYCVLILGLAWFLASLGTFLRDISQVLGTVVTATMFLSPIFFPLSALPEWIQPWLILNPVALPVEQIRDLLIFGRLPDWSSFFRYAIAASAIGVCGFAWFRSTRRGFADVL
jgi:lipopolysaccharide transport system permease protein